MLNSDRIQKCLQTPTVADTDTLSNSFLFVVEQLGQIGGGVVVRKRYNMIHRFNEFYLPLLTLLLLCFLTPTHADEMITDWKAAEIPNNTYIREVIQSKKDTPTLERLAENGNYYAQYVVGTDYHMGKGVTQNYKKSFNWFLRAAKNGHLEAMVELWLMSIDGSTKEKFRLKGDEWLKCAATIGHRSAQHFLGLQYSNVAMRLKIEKLKSLIEKGGKPKHNFVESEKYKIKGHMWLNLAAAQGYPQSAEARDQIASLMSQEELEKAQNLASNWMKRTDKCKVQQDSK